MDRPTDCPIILLLTFMASSVYSGRLNLAAASLALDTVGLEMMIGLASGLWGGGDVGIGLDWRVGWVNE